MRCVSPLTDHWAHVNSIPGIDDLEDRNFTVSNVNAPYVGRKDPAGDMTGARMRPSNFYSPHSQDTGPGHRRNEERQREGSDLERSKTYLEGTNRVIRDDRMYYDDRQGTNMGSDTPRGESERTRLISSIDSISNEFERVELRTTDQNDLQTSPGRRTLSNNVSLNYHESAAAGGRRQSTTHRPALEPLCEGKKLKPPHIKANNDIPDDRLDKRKTRSLS